MISRGITFGSKQTFNDWGLYLSTRPVIAPPEVRTKYIDIPGTNGALDLSEILGGVTYKTRNFNVTLVAIRNRNNWDSIYSTVMGYLHGQRRTMILDDDPQYRWSGRFSVDSITYGDRTCKIAISGTLKPYKVKISDGTEVL